MSSDGEYENPALDDEATFDNKPPQATISRYDLVKGWERFGSHEVEDEIEVTPASPGALAEIAQADEREKAQDAEWDQSMESIRVYVSDAIFTRHYPNTDDTMKTTAFLDELRADKLFMARIVPCVNEGLHAEENTGKITGYGTDFTIYTLAFHKDWLIDVPSRQDLLGALPGLRTGLPSRDGLLNSGFDVEQAEGSLRNVLGQVLKGYKHLHKTLVSWKDDAGAHIDAEAQIAAERIDLTDKKCAKLQSSAYMVIWYEEQLLQDYAWHIEHGEVDEDDIEIKLPELKRYLREMAKAAVFTHMDGLREVKRQHGNGTPT